ncbi:uncharacterized protein LOC109615413 [Esox lucius]|uniref:uncharacterized protein LOC109615413 n=1 Tax=Esox lucius TaxID=8010 RepID=UPI0014771BAC|nr:uncharacterized protein LOC109615413 [Esox lucius]
MDFLQFLSQFGPLHPFPLDEYTWTVLKMLPKDVLASWLMNQMTGGPPMSGVPSQTQGQWQSQFFNTSHSGFQYQPNSVSATFQPNSSQGQDNDDFMDWTEGPQVTNNIGLWQNQVPCQQHEQPMDVDVGEVKHNKSAGTSLPTICPSHSAAAKTVLPSKSVATTEKTIWDSQSAASTKKTLWDSQSAASTNKTIWDSQSVASTKKTIWDTQSTASTKKTIWDSQSAASAKKTVSSSQSASRSFHQNELQMDVDVAEVKKTNKPAGTSRATVCPSHSAAARTVLPGQSATSKDTVQFKRPEAPMKITVFPRKSAGTSHATVCPSHSAAAKTVLPGQSATSETTVQFKRPDVSRKTTVLPRKSEDATSRSFRQWNAAQSGPSSKTATSQASTSQGAPGQSSLTQTAVSNSQSATCTKRHGDKVRSSSPPWENGSKRRKM